MKDPFVGVIKGVIARLNPWAQVIDLTHLVSAQGVEEAAFLLASSYRYFPPGTIHVAVVDPGVGGKRKIVAMKAGGYTFLCPDNGLLTLILRKEEPLEMVEVKESKYFLPEVSATFHGRDIFAPVAARLALGFDLKCFGPPLKEGLVELPFPRPLLNSHGHLLGEVIHIDRFGNLILNITHKDLLAHFGREAVEVHIGSWRIEGVSTSYIQGEEKRAPIALFGSTDHLEVALYGRSAQEELGLGKGERVRVSKGAQK